MRSVLLSRGSQTLHVFFCHISWCCRLTVSSVRINASPVWINSLLFAEKRLGVMPGLLADWLVVTGPVSTATSGPRPWGHMCLAVMEWFHNNSRTRDAALKFSQLYFYSTQIMSDQLHRVQNSRINDGNSVSVVKQLSNTIESLFGSIQ